MIELIKDVLDKRRVDPKEVAHENLLAEVYDVVWKLVKVQKLMLLMQFITMITILLLV